MASQGGVWNAPPLILQSVDLVRQPCILFAECSLSETRFQSLDVVDIVFVSELARLYRKKGEPVSSGPIIEARAANLAACLLSLRPSFCPEKAT